MSLLVFQNPWGRKDKNHPPGQSISDKLKIPLAPRIFWARITTLLFRGINCEGCKGAKQIFEACNINSVWNTLVNLNIWKKNVDSK